MLLWTLSCQMLLELLAPCPRVLCGGGCRVWARASCEAGGTVPFSISKGLGVVGGGSRKGRVLEVDQIVAVAQWCPSPVQGPAFMEYGSFPSRYLREWGECQRPR